MYGLPNGDRKKHPVAIVSLVLLGLIGVWLAYQGSRAQLAQDFEECAERAQSQLASDDESGALMRACNARFAGRRKSGGGYTYFDFMQNRHFDIAGPNPTAEERKQIDSDYMSFLDAQRSEAISAELAKRQNEQLRADLEGIGQAVAPPTGLSRKNQASSAAKRTVDKSKSIRCEEASLMCSWAKFSAAVKNAFASSSRAGP
jgi:hypothetical protein